MAKLDQVNGMGRAKMKLKTETQYMNQQTECMTLDSPYIKPHMKNKWGELFNKYEWQWAITLTVDHPISKEVMKHRFLEWRSWICMKEHLRIGYAIVLCSHPHCHLHALMVGQNRDGKSLQDVDKMKWKKIWIDKSNGMIVSREYKPLSLAANKVENVLSSKAYGAYMGQNIQSNNFDYELSSPRFLKKFSK